MTIRCLLSQTLFVQFNDVLIIRPVLSDNLSIEIGPSITGLYHCPISDNSSLILAGYATITAKFYYLPDIWQNYEHWYRSTWNFTCGRSSHIIISILLIGVNVKLLPHVEVPGEPVHAAGLCRLLGQQGNRQHQVTGDPDTLHNKNGDTNIDDTRGIYF